MWPRRKIAQTALASPVEERILAFRALPRTQEKIVSLLVRHCPDPESKATLDGRVAQGQLVVVSKNGRRQFRAACEE